MRRSTVPAFDLLPAGHARQRVWHRRTYRALALPLCLGLTVSIVLQAQIRANGQSVRDEQTALQAEIDRLKAQDRQWAAQAKEQQARQALVQASQLQAQRWLGAGDALRAVARPLGPPAQAQLLELRLDDQGLLLIGQIGPAQLQPWLDGLRSRAPALGTAWLMEMGPPAAAWREEDGVDLSRFVVRFPQAAASAGAARP